MAKKKKRKFESETKKDIIFRYAAEELFINQPYNNGELSFKTVDECEEIFKALATEDKSWISYLKGISEANKNNQPTKITIENDKINFWWGEKNEKREKFLKRIEKHLK